MDKLIISQYSGQSVLTGEILKGFFMEYKPYNIKQGIQVFGKSSYHIINTGIQSPHINNEVTLNSVVKIEDIIIKGE